MALPNSLWGTPNVTTVADVIRYAQSFPDCMPILGNLAGFTREPGLSFSNTIMQRILAQGMNWKWNRRYIEPFLTVALQQDYVTQATDVGWLETCQLVDINNNTNTANLGSKPIRDIEVVRDLFQSSLVSTPSKISYLPNRLAAFGIWQPNTLYPTGYGAATTPSSPIQQFVDANGNILFIDSTSLNLNYTSPGYGSIGPGTIIGFGQQGYGGPPGYGGSTTSGGVTGNGPYGMSGFTEPLLDPEAPAGATVLDGTVTWTVADPNGFAIRFEPVPALSSICWLAQPVYQAKAPWFVDPGTTIAPIPQEYTYLFQDGFVAKCKYHADSRAFRDAYANWEEDLLTALRAADREQSDSNFYPSEGIMGGQCSPFPVGPAWPFDQGPGWY